LERKLELELGMELHRSLGDRCVASLWCRLLRVCVDRLQEGAGYLSLCGVAVGGLLVAVDVVNCLLLLVNWRFVAHRRM
jgi:hypothetical protein